MAEIIKGDAYYIWRETAPATFSGYVELLELLYKELKEREAEGWCTTCWSFRVPPVIELIKEFDLELAYYECRFRLIRHR